LAKKRKLEVNRKYRESEIGRSKQKAKRSYRKTEQGKMEIGKAPVAKYKAENLFFIYYFV